jgi:hypothetical protein
MPLPWFLDEDGQKKKKREKLKRAQEERFQKAQGAFEDEPDRTPLAMRYFLAEEWRKLAPEQQEVVRSQRARRGIRCEVCGAVGYYTETCAKGCTFDVPTPDSLDLTPPPSPKRPGSPDGKQQKEQQRVPGTGAGERDVGLGILWGSLGFDASSSVTAQSGEKKPAQVAKRADLGGMREESQDRLSELKMSDSHVHSFEFFTRAEEGYNRSLPELTLHQILRKIVRIVEKNIAENVRHLEAKVDKKLLLPPDDPPSAHFYPPEMGKMKEYTDFFSRKKKRLERTDRLAYKFQGNQRPDDALDALFRGAGSASKEAQLQATLDLYKPDPKAGRSMHAKIGWKSNLAKNDLLAVADPRAAAKQAEVENLFKAQGAWTEKQKVDMEQRNDRFEHLVHIIRSELAKEHEREARELSQESGASRRQAQMDVFLERLKSVDHLLEVLRLYKLSGPIEESDVLFFQLTKWKEELTSRLKATRTRTRASRGRSTATTAPSTAASAGGGRQEEEEEGGGGDSFGFDELEKSSAKKSIKAGTNKTNSMIAKGENPYYEADQYIEKHKLLTRHLAKKGNWDHSTPSRYLDGVDSPGGRSPFPAQQADPSPGKALEAGAATSPGGGDDAATATTATTADSSVDGGTGGGGVRSALGAMLVAQAKQRQLEAKIRQGVEQSKAEVDELIHADEKRRLKMAGGWRAKTFARKYAKPQREVDAAEMAKTRGYFEEVDFGHHVRNGNRFDLAYLKPALIPVPGAFVGDGKHALKSYEGEKAVERAKAALVSDLGYTPQRLLPLYVRNTVLEHNGTSAGGDQTQEVMALDRRYSHYIGRPLNRFEPGKDLVDSKQFQKSSKGFGPNAKELAARLAPIKAAREAEREKKRKEAMEFNPINRSLVRVVFGLPVPDNKDVYFRES